MSTALGCNCDTGQSKQLPDDGIGGGQRGLLLTGPTCDPGTQRTDFGGGSPRGHRRRRTCLLSRRRRRILATGARPVSARTQQDHGVSGPELVVYAKRNAIKSVLQSVYWGSKRERTTPMAANRYRQYSVHALYDIQVRAARAERLGETRRTAHLTQGEPDKAHLAWARGQVTKHQWLTLTHPALVASAAHPDATTTLTREEERQLLARYLAEPRR